MNIKILSRLLFSCLISVGAILYCMVGPVYLGFEPLGKLTGIKDGDTYMAISVGVTAFVMGFVSWRIFYEKVTTRNPSIRSAIFLGMESGLVSTVMTAAVFLVFVIVGSLVKDYMHHHTFGIMEIAATFVMLIVGAFIGIFMIIPALVYGIIAGILFSLINNFVIIKNE